MAIVNDDGHAVAGCEYEPSGGIISPITEPPKNSHFCHGSYIHDRETDLYYLQSRYYDPGMGRFINADSYPSTGDGTLSNNMFAYCLNSPTNRVDAEGSWSLPNWAKVAIGVAVIAVAAVATVATGGAAAGTVVAAVHCAAQGALVGAVTQGAIGAASGAVTGAISHRIATGSWDGAGKAAIDGAATGFMEGTITGAITGAATSPYCFVAGTTVLTVVGSVAIETIQKGDLVWAWDEETGEVALKEVVETYVNETDELVHVFVNGEEIVTTPGHPFYSPVKGWTDAVHLRAGDILVLVNGEYVVVEKVQHEILETPVTVYNFQVEDYHTYFVTDTGILVHNSCNHGREWGHERRSHWRSQGQNYQNNVHGQLSDNGLYRVTQTNVDRMIKGRAPIGIDNKSVVLHHTKGIANDFYDYVEMLSSTHTSKFKELHGFLFK